MVTVSQLKRLHGEGRRQEGWAAASETRLGTQETLLCGIGQNNDKALSTGKVTVRGNYPGRGDRAVDGDPARPLTV